MFSKFKTLLSVAVIALSLTASAFAQETTGNIEGTVKDPQGGVVPGAQVTVQSKSRVRDVANPGGVASGGFNRTVTTDDSGFFRVIQVPPGFYTVTIEATSGFGAYTADNVEVVLGKTTPIEVLVKAGGVAEVVNVTADAVAIDPTDNKIQTNITAQVAELLPKGTNFTSLLQVSPAVRNEPLSGGFQIDGSSGSENTFIIDGQEVTNFRTGELNINNNLPFQIVQEVQVKSSGFEAEFGGATGGVINVVTKGGTNDWHGEFGMHFAPARFQTAPRRSLLLNPQGNSEYFQFNRDSGTNFFPTANIGGPILKNRLWGFISYTPQFFNTERTINYLSTGTPRTLRESQTYRSDVRREYLFTRLDGQVTDKLRLTGTFLWNPVLQEGLIPVNTSLFAGVPNGPTDRGLLRGSAFQGQLGGRQNSNNTSASGVWTPTSNFVLSVRGGHNFLNEKLGSYGVPNLASGEYFSVNCSSLSRINPPAAAACGRGQTNGAAILDATAFDASRRNTFDVDATYIVSNLGGRHQFKGGYQYNGLSNKVNKLTTPQVILRYGFGIGEYSGRNIDSTAGAIGAGRLARIGTVGDVSSKNEGVFFQDQWQPTDRLTLNLGLRFERENVPSFTEGAPDLTFGWGDKIAPRLGVAYALTDDGRTKLFGSYGWFYDRFKYELPRGSFGGDFFRSDYFELFENQGPSFTFFSPARIRGSAPDEAGGQCPLTGGGGLTRCLVDHRIPSNAGLGIEFGAVDPDIKAMRQSEFTVGAERDLGRGLLFSGRFTWKKIDEAIEDAGFLTSTGGEAYIIGNPGRGLHKEVAEANGFIALKPERDYKALELRLDKRFTNNWYFNANYTFSRLYGNYSGLASSDEDGRVSPNVNRFFDLPHAGFTAAGGPDNGRLPTDRPHAFKFYGSYTLDWNRVFGGGAGNRTEFSGFTTLQSGTPLTTEVDIYGIDTIVLNGRGDLGRTEKYSQTDLALSHKYTFGAGERFTMAFDFNVLNVFNESNVLDRYSLISSTDFALDDPALGILTDAESHQANAVALAIGRFQRNGLPALRGIVNSADEKDPRFNQADLFQAGRSVRLGFRLLF